MQPVVHGGDVDGGGTVDAIDFGQFLGNFGQTVPPGNAAFDFDNGGTVDAVNAETIVGEEIGLSEGDEREVIRMYVDWLFGMFR